MKLPYDDTEQKSISLSIFALSMISRKIIFQKNFQKNHTDQNAELFAASALEARRVGLKPWTLFSDTTNCSFHSKLTLKTTTGRNGSLLFSHKHGTKMQHCANSHISNSLPKSAIGQGQLGLLQPQSEPRLVVNRQLAFFAGIMFPGMCL